MGGRPQWIELELRRRDYLSRQAEAKRRELIAEATQEKKGFGGYAVALLHMADGCGRTEIGLRWQQLVHKLLASLATNSPEIDQKINIAQKAEARIQEQFGITVPEEFPEKEEGRSE